LLIANKQLTGSAIIYYFLNIFPASAIPKDPSTTQTKEL
jgi:hypothetical protein